MHTFTCHSNSYWSMERKKMSNSNRFLFRDMFLSAHQHSDCRRLNGQRFYYLRNTDLQRLCASRRHAEKYAIKTAQCFWAVCERVRVYIWCLLTLSANVSKHLQGDVVVSERENVERYTLRHWVVWLLSSSTVFDLIICTYAPLSLSCQWSDVMCGPGAHIRYAMKHPSANRFRN